MSVPDKDCEKVANILSGCGREKNACPIKDIMASYGDKWSMYTILLLGQHSQMRFSRLRLSIAGISQRMLTVTLRSLEQDGMVCRKHLPQTPHRVEYCLTELGEGLFSHLFALATWADKNIATIVAARNNYKPAGESGQLL